MNALRAQVKMHLMLIKLMALYIFQIIKSNGTLMLRKIQTTTMNLFMHYNKLLIRVLFFEKKKMYCTS
jgi:hypothetical protein